MLCPFLPFPKDGVLIHISHGSDHPQSEEENRSVSTPFAEKKTRPVGSICLDQVDP